MALKGPIVIIEDDVNDAQVIVAAIQELEAENELKVFHFAEDALEYLMATNDRPLIILSDIRMPVLDGLNLLKRIHSTAYLRKKAIPFVFLSAMASPEIVNEAYEIGVQGFYKKGTNFSGLKEQLYSILIYWNRSLHPNVDFP